MNFQYLAVSLMKPGYDDDLVTWSKAIEGLSRERMYLKPRVRSALSALHRGVLKIFQAGPDYADWAKPCSLPGRQSRFSALNSLLFGSHGDSQDHTFWMVQKMGT